MIFETVALIGIARVIDGDTLELQHPIAPPFRIRLEAIEAPERHTPAGKRATADLAALIEGKWIICDLRMKRTGWPKTTYRRLVANCSVNGIDLAPLILESPWIAEAQP